MRPAPIALWQQRREAARLAGRGASCWKTCRSIAVSHCCCSATCSSEPERLPATTEAWCNYVTRWEQGYTRQNVAPRQSIAQLLTTLGHSYFAIDDSGATAKVDAKEFADGAHGLPVVAGRRAGEGRCSRPLDVATVPRSDAMARAQAHLEYEFERYQRALRHGKVCQLAVPLAASGRRLLVDALFLEEHVASGLLKVFARNDCERSWTRRGFEVLGIHRPSLRGTGNDMVDLGLEGIRADARGPVERA